MTPMHGSPSGSAAATPQKHPEPTVGSVPPTGLGPCSTCGNVYDKAFEVVRGRERHVFDSFECAITALAPTCVHCNCRIVGHGMEKDGRMFCCAHCASHSGAGEMRDRS